MQDSATSSIKPVTPPAWRLRSADEATVVALARATGLSEIMARILVNRRVKDAASAERFLNTKSSHIHDPGLMADMEKAVERLIRAMRAGETVCVYGDYDVDGAVGTAMLVTFFSEVGFNVRYYIPNRLAEGYSLNKPALSRLREEGVTLVVTVDNGIMAFEAVEHAAAIGMEIIVTDHHQVGPALPQAVAVVNPQRKDCAYPFKGICGAGVAYKLLLALRRRLRADGFFAARPEPNLKSYLDYLSLATVCDMVPLGDENRYFVKEGLKHLRRTPRPGLKALIDVSGLGSRELTAADLGFRLGPRLNACGRLADASLGVRMLLSRDPLEALTIARDLDRLNAERRGIEEKITAEALGKAAAAGELPLVSGLVVFDPSWHIGVVGIVASRLTETLRRPAFVLGLAGDGSIKGSGRSVRGVNLMELLRECAPHLRAHGGHEAAAGVTLAPEELPGFTRAFDEAAKRRLGPGGLERLVWVDDRIAPERVGEELARDIEKLEPFGIGNARPVFVAKGWEVRAKRVVGKNHLKLTLGADGREVDAIAFNKAEAHAVLGEKTGLLFGVEMNEFNNRRRLQLVVQDFLPPDGGVDGDDAMC